MHIGLQPAAHRVAHRVAACEEAAAQQPAEERVAPPGPDLAKVEHERRPATRTRLRVLRGQWGEDKRGPATRARLG